MHHCLSVSELILAICCSSNDAALANLAQTCKTFQEPALNVLYSDLDCMSKLLMCLPQDLWRVEEGDTNEQANLSFTRQLQPADWQVLQRYAARVRFLRIGGAICQAPIGSLFEDRYRVDDPLFPNLTTLTIYADGCYPPCVLLFLGPNLRTLVLDNCDLHARFLRGVVDHVHLSQGIKHLKVIRNDSYWLEDEEDPGDAVVDPESLAQLRQLETLTFEEEITPELLTAISSLQSLTSLRIVVPPTLRLESRPNLGHFPRLRHLDLQGAPPEEYGYLLRYAYDSDLSAVEQLEVCFNECEGHNFARFLETLDSTLGKSTPDLNSRKNAMRTLHITQSSPSSLGDTVKGDALRRLFCFGELTELVITPFLVLELDDVLMQDLSSALPHLCHFDLIAKYPDSPNVTLTGLASVIRNCRSLRQLALSVDATVVRNRDHHGTVTSIEPHMNLSALGVGRSPMDDPAFVAQQLSAMAPKLCKITVARQVVRVLHPPRDDIYIRWTRVQTILRSHIPE
ncbi:hypothetical protein CONPUDRAFT_147332 [Coniophora puteana RWD-64-598 SS2]|uniref:F-box domain-containing protein n=1 Tax=Coniophora puteana (strain RWD-64-598) TaxID=741705 RepID=A0A5M3M7H8_CONPW|nr:uncharacterized protein CONPUDRAFT_147332 [Coniophora puteana RWD-64-598 SS2]EIW75199.1 hypothetical protein CONPUDRAFT_147332 [Coniophora puteana RWD-64-598 SS2]